MIRRYVETSGEKNFIERIKAPIFFEAVLATKIMQDPQSILEKRVNSSILKDDFSSRTEPISDMKFQDLSQTLSKALDITSATTRVVQNLLKALALLSDTTVRRSAVDR